MKRLSLILIATGKFKRFSFLSTIAPVSGQNRRARKNPALPGPDWDSSPGPTLIPMPLWSEDQLFILLASLLILTYHLSYSSASIIKSLFHAGERGLDDRKIFGQRQWKFTRQMDKLQLYVMLIYYLQGNHVIRYFLSYFFLFTYFQQQRKRHQR